MVGSRISLEFISCCCYFCYGTQEGLEVIMFLIYQSSQSSSYRTDTHYYAQLEVLAFSNYHLHSSVFLSVFALVPRYEAQAGLHIN